jgi:hypothetical protein
MNFLKGAMNSPQRRDEPAQQACEQTCGCEVNNPMDIWYFQ